MAYRRIDLGKEKGDRRKQRAAALRYDPEKEDAPRVVASGKYRIAEEIIEAAKEHDIPIHEDPVLATTLTALDVDDMIPPELYKVVAEILAYVYRIKEKQIPDG